MQFGMANLEDIKNDLNKNLGKPTKISQVTCDVNFFVKRRCR